MGKLTQCEYLSLRVGCPSHSRQIVVAVKSLLALFLSTFRATESGNRAGRHTTEVPHSGDVGCHHRARSDSLPLLGFLAVGNSKPMAENLPLDLLIPPGPAEGGPHTFGWVLSSYRLEDRLEVQKIEDFVAMLRRIASSFARDAGRRNDEAIWHHPVQPPRIAEIVQDNTRRASRTRSDGPAQKAKLR